MNKSVSGAIAFAFACTAWVSAVGGLPAEAGSCSAGQVRIDGSSTVFPIVEAIAEEYARQQPRVKTPISISGTGGGFHRFAKGEIDLNNASRPMKPEEQVLAEQHAVSYTRFSIAYDGLSVIVHPENTWMRDMTAAELRRLWEDNGTIKKWSHIRPEWPDKEIHFYAPGVDSGTYDYFQEAILEGKQITRAVTFSEDDNVIVRGVSTDLYAVAFLGYAYYIENQQRVRAVAVDGVLPTKESIKSGMYKPLSRPLYIYASADALRSNACVYDYMTFALQHAAPLVEEVGYVALPSSLYNRQLRQLEAAGKTAP